MARQIKVVFASLLKPVDEPRMYEKLGRSLAQTYKYDVNIIGFSSKNLPKDPLVTFWPIFNFKRISIGRMLAPFRFFKMLLQLKPALIIASGTDLLLVSGLYKIIFGCEIVNDLQENYYRNILWSHAHPSLLRRMRASYIRMQEKLIDRIIIQYLLAEYTYLAECSFINKPYLVLENKAHKPDDGLLAKKEKKEPLQLVYTGTIASSYGIFDAIQLAEAIHK
ncbi:MAG: glycosyltransferase, partial [Bacteroidetes bacterium]|nr:glycosyltransferase [Bacteroidota bacterium]